MTKKLSSYINAYQQQLTQGDIEVAYVALQKYIRSLKTNLAKALSSEYQFGNISPGNLDYTYFPFFTPRMRTDKLRFGLVLNHQAMQFELWLLGQNEQVHLQYWNLLKATLWNAERTSMPRYSVLEVTVSAQPNFDDLETLTTEIINHTISNSEEILATLNEINHAK